MKSLRPVTLPVLPTMSPKPYARLMHSLGSGFAPPEAPRKLTGSVKRGLNRGRIA